MSNNYRPVCDRWILSHPKVAYHGHFPGGFLERARCMVLGGRRKDLSILFVCGGKVKEYPTKGNLSGFFENDLTIDIDPALEPDICMDVRELDQVIVDEKTATFNTHLLFEKTVTIDRPDAIIVDRPYTDDDADQYLTGRKTLPPLNKLLGDCLRIVKPGATVGVLDYLWPGNKEKDLYKNWFSITVSCGENSRERVFTGWCEW